VGHLSNGQSVVNRNVRIAVVGCINRDTVRQLGEPTVRGFGGTLYNIFGLSQLLGDNAEIFPVCNLGNDASKPVFGLLSQLSNVNPANIKVVPTTNNHCRMTYRADCERDEIFSGFVPAISLRQLARVADCDIALINFISGHDMTLNTLKKFREMYRGTLYFDFHTLSLGLRKNGRRFLRKPRRWAEYIACCDYLQMNRREFILLSGNQPDKQLLSSFFRRYVMPTGSAMLITLGADGAVLVSQSGRKISVRYEKPAGMSKVSDTTGAGDLFAAGFCAGLAKRKPLANCLRLAVRAGTYGCSITHPQDVALPNLD
jgi:sugar/nucleoside kinase (ribokinase family)